MNVIDAFNWWFANLHPNDQQALLQYLHDSIQPQPANTYRQPGRQVLFRGYNLGAPATPAPPNICPYCKKPI